MFTPDLGALSSLPESPDYAWSLVGRLPEALAAQERNAVGWTAVTGASMDAVLSRARSVPGFHHAAMGFLDQSVDLGFDFANVPIGVVLYTSADPEASYGLPDRLDPGVFEPIRPETSELSFPVTVRPGHWRAGGSHTPGRVTPPTVRRPARMLGDDARRQV